MRPQNPWNPKVGCTEMSEPATFLADGEHATERLGQALAAVLQPGTVVALCGPLGAGKTRLVQAVANALGVSEGTVTSPTFVLINEYATGRRPIYHFDVYRLRDDDEFLELGPEEYFASQGLTFVEWANRVEALLPAERLEVEIAILGDTARRFKITGTTPTLDAIANEVASRLSAT